MTPQQFYELSLMLGGCVVGALGFASVWFAIATRIMYKYGLSREDEELGGSSRRFEMRKLYHKVRRWLRYWLVDDVHPGYEPMRFAMRGAIYVILIAAAIVVLGIGAILLVGCKGGSVPIASITLSLAGIVYLSLMSASGFCLWKFYRDRRPGWRCWSWYWVFAVFFTVACFMIPSCGPECAPAFPIVGDYPGGAGRYEFHATHRLANGVRIELHRPDLLEELDAVVTRTLEFAKQLGPTLTGEEMDEEHGFCLAHLARNPRCDERECLRVKVLPLREAYVSRIDRVTLLLRDEVDLYDDAGCWFLKPGLNPDLPGHWPAGCQSDGVCVAPLPSGEYFRDANGEPVEGVYGRWRGLARALIDWKLGCYNSVLISRVQAYLREVP